MLDEWPEWVREERSDASGPLDQHDAYCFFMWVTARRRIHLETVEPGWERNQRVWSRKLERWLEEEGLIERIP